MFSTVINVSNRLPVTVGADKITKSSGGLVAALNGLCNEPYATKWIGWPGAAYAETSREQEIERILSEEYGCDSVQRLLGIEAELTHIRSDRRCTTLGVYPIGINAVNFENA